MFKAHPSEVRPLIKKNSVISEFYFFFNLNRVSKQITQLTHQVRPQP